MFNEKEYQKNYFQKHKEKLLKISNDYQKKHREKKKEYQKKYRDTHKEEIRLYNIKYNKEHKYEIKKHRNIYKEELLEYSQEYRKNHKEEIKKQRKEWYQLHKNERNQYQNKKFQTNINYRIIHNLRGRLYKAFIRNPKLDTTINLLSCSIEQLKTHLGKQFTEGMSWNNYGQWHIDHIKPCASFDLSKPSEQAKCFNYLNLQPLWAKDNLSKGKQIL